MALKSLQQLLDIIQLEQLDTTLFRGQNYITPWKRVFGGQVLGQALNAAYRTVDETRLAHSLHGYFILSGDVSKPVIYQVDITRDGGSFSTRRVTASQNGKAIFVMAASFQLNQEGFEHQVNIPDVAGPANLQTDIQQIEVIKDFAPGLYKKMMARAQGAIEFRPVENILVPDPDITDPIKNVWMKLTDKAELDRPLQHQLLAYASDYDLLLTAVYPHRAKFDPSKLFIASLDHAMWFHRDFDFNDWLLYTINSPSASNSRGMGIGHIYNQAGALVSTVVQEGLIRVNK